MYVFREHSISYMSRAAEYIINELFCVRRGACGVNYTVDDTSFAGAKMGEYHQDYIEVKLKKVCGLWRVRGSPRKSA